MLLPRSLHADILAFKSRTKRPTYRWIVGLPIIDIGFNIVLPQRKIKRTNGGFTVKFLNASLTHTAVRSLLAVCVRKFPFHRIITLVQIWFPPSGNTGAQAK
jgi:hypothetical protein